MPSNPTHITDCKNVEIKYKGVYQYRRFENISCADAVNSFIEQLRNGNFNAKNLRNLSYLVRATKIVHQDDGNKQPFSGTLVNFKLEEFKCLHNAKDKNGNRYIEDQRLQMVYEILKMILESHEKVLIKDLGNFDNWQQNNNPLPDFYTVTIGFDAEKRVSIRFENIYFLKFDSHIIHLVSNSFILRKEQYPENNLQAT